MSLAKDVYDITKTRRYQLQNAMTRREKREATPPEAAYEWTVPEFPNRDLTPHDVKVKALSRTTAPPAPARTLKVLIRRLIDTYGRRPTVVGLVLENGEVLTGVLTKWDGVKLANGELLKPGHNLEYTSIQGIKWLA